MLDDVKVVWNGQQLLVRNVEVNYTLDDLPSVSIEAFVPQTEIKGSFEVTMPETAEKVIEELLRSTGMDRCEEKASCDDRDYGAHQLAKRVIDLDLTDEERLLRKYHIVAEDGTVTARGKELLLNVLFGEYREDIVEKLEALDKESKKEGFVD